MTARQSLGRLLCVVVVVMATLTACGSGNLADNLAEGTTQPDLQITIGDGSGDGAGIAVNGDDSFQISTDEGEMQLGIDEAPDWLPSDFYLPPDFHFVGSSSNTTTGTLEFGGVSSSLGIDELLPDLRDHLVNAGYELIGEDAVNHQIVLAKNGVGLITLGTSEGMLGFPDDTGLSAVIEQNADIEEARLEHQPEAVSEGEAVVTVEGTEYRVAGECRIDGHASVFGSTDGTTTLDVDTSMTPTYAAGSMIDFSVDPPIFLTMNTSLPGGEDIQVESSASGFSATGPMTDGLDSTQPLVNGSIVVTCG